MRQSGVLDVNLVCNYKSILDSTSSISIDVSNDTYTYRRPLDPYRTIIKTQLLAWRVGICVRVFDDKTIYPMSRHQTFSCVKCCLDTGSYSSCIEMSAVEKTDNISNEHASNILFCKVLPGYWII